ncbi:uncharacterized protein TNIN_469971 [Trichonephila inaurata madagascariensis]|uniref:Uncharacterized protein n=1 Tax=Trichonephila inaurata madagascariensis TaxID=2747483 RepID=A0A8X6XRE4_9ARAC|nr:uncharacterized protein TNIN_469971 [Trichonephila inaurata madagascariensis]
MILLKTGSILLFCLISVSAQDTGKGESSEIKEKEATADLVAQPSTNVESKSKPIAKASKVSEFFIGDLLRTSDKDQLETSSTVHNPLSSTPEYRNHRIPEDASIIAGYKAPAGHVYAGEDIILSLTQQGRIPIPVQLAGDRSAEAYENVPVQQAGVLQRNAVPSEGVVPVSRRYEQPYSGHKGSDCKKHAHTTSASEERYVSNGRVPYSEGRSSPPSAEYRNPERYRDEDSHEDSPSHSSQSAPGYSETYPSKSKSYTSDHDSDTRSKSKSMDSYTTSKSTSSSRTVNPKNKGGKVFVFNNRKPAQESFSSRPREQRSRNKNKQRPSHDSASYSDEPPSYQSPHEDEPPAQYHHQSYPPQAPTRHSPSSYSNSQSAGAPKQSHHYSEQPAPAHHERGSYRRPKEPQNTRYYKDEYSQPEAPVRQHSPPPPPKYHSTEDAEEPSGPYRTRNEQPYANEPPSHHHGGNRPQNSGSYNSPQQYRDAPQYQQEAPPSRQPKGGRNPNYGGYSQENAPPRSEVPYERNPVPPRSSGMKRPEYAYEETPYTSNESNENYQRPRRPAGRAVRSSAQHYKPGVGEGTADSRESVQHRARELMVKENLPQQYGSVSFSESSYNMGEPPTTKMVPLPKNTNVQSRMYERPEKMINPLLSVPQGSEGRDPGYQTSYNPSSYAPGQYPRDPQGPEPHSAEQDYEPESYEEPHEGPEENYDSHSPKGHTKTKSDITGYKDSYDTHEPLDLDDAFFEKYGISKNAKIIVATPMNPGLFVADGTGIAEGGESDDESQERINEEPSSNQNSREPVEYSPKIEADDEIEEPKSQFELPQEAPGSFTQLVDFNPKFMRKLKRSKRPEIGDFQEYDPSLDELVFRSGVGDPKEFVRSQGSREIVQQHGDGVSRIIFNQVTKKQKEAATENKEEYLPNQEDSEEKLESAKVEKVLKPETVVEKSA